MGTTPSPLLRGHDVKGRQTLTLIHCDRDGAPWIPTLRGEAIHRARLAARVGEPTPRLTYSLLSQADISLSFVGRAPNHEVIARTLHGLATGDELTLAATENGVFLQFAYGLRAGALSKEVAQRWRSLLPRVKHVRVAAILVRKRSDEGPEFQDRPLRDAWQVVVPEIACCLDDGDAK